MATTKATSGVVEHDIIRVKDYGATGDGSTDDTAAINAGITAAAGRTLYFPAGTYKTSSNITLAGGVRLVGDTGTTTGAGTVIQPTSAVTIAVIMQDGDIENINIDGVNTSGKTGLRIGTTLTSNHTIAGCRIHRFVGAGGIGLEMRNSVSVVVRDCYLDANAMNLFISGAGGGGTPTTGWFYDTAFRSSTIDEGVLMDAGQQITFNNCVFENNYKEGFKFVITSGITAIFNHMVNCWFEGNWSSASTDTTKFQCYVDGAAGSEAGMHFDNIYFNGSATTPRSMYFNDVKYTSLSKVSCPAGVAGSIKVETASSEVVFIDDAGRQAAALIDNPDDAIISLPIYKRADATDAFAMEEDIEFRAGVGVKFPSTDTLDDYDVGYHTPTVVGASSGSYTLNSSSNSLRYVKIGEMVHVQGLLNITSESSPVGQIRISLPFVISDLTDAAEQIYAPTRLDGHGDAGIEQPSLLATPGVSYVSLANHTDAGVYEVIDQTRVDTNWYVSVSLTYVST